MIPVLAGPSRPDPVIEPHRFNGTRLYGAIGHIPRIKYYCQITARQQPLPGELALH
jgi:hypothetical protein